MKTENNERSTNYINSIVNMVSEWNTHEHVLYGVTITYNLPKQKIQSRFNLDPYYNEKHSTEYQYVNRHLFKITNSINHFYHLYCLRGLVHKNKSLSKEYYDLYPKLVGFVDVPRIKGERKLFSPEGLHHHCTMSIHKSLLPRLEAMADRTRPVIRDEGLDPDPDNFFLVAKKSREWNIQNENQKKELLSDWYSNKELKPADHIRDILIEKIFDLGGWIDYSMKYYVHRLETRNRSYTYRNGRSLIADDGSLEKLMILHPKSKLEMSSRQRKNG